MHSSLCSVVAEMQYPEHQLFETDIFKDVCFGPKNLGLPKMEVELRAFEALRLVGLDENLYYQSPFDLSGGQKRRVAIAGVLAMRPDVLILDEPTAGLDPKGRDEILDSIKDLKEKTGITVILVSHSMEDVAKYVNRIMVMNDGVLIYDDTPKHIFAGYRELEQIGLAAPQVTYIMNDLKNAGFAVDVNAITVEERQIRLGSQTEHFEEFTRDSWKGIGTQIYVKRYYHWTILSDRFGDSPVRPACKTHGNADFYYHAFFGKKRVAVSGCYRISGGSH